MKKLTVICLGLIAGGCATTEQLLESNAKIQELEKKIARIEGDLYKVEVKSSPKQVVESKFVPAKEVEQNVVDAKINVFLKEYLGVAIGDAIDKYDVDDEARHRWRPRKTLSARKKFKYFDNVTVWFENDKVYQVDYFARFPRKFSKTSVDEQCRQAIADLAVSLDLSSDAFNGGKTRSHYSLWCLSDRNTSEFWVRGVSFYDREYHKRLEAERRQRENDAGERLPDAK